MNELPSERKASKQASTTEEPSQEALKKAIINYRIMCDMAVSDRDDGSKTQEEYEKAIEWELNRVIALIKQSNSHLLNRIREKMPEKKYVSKYIPHDKYPRGFNACLDQIYAILDSEEKL